MDHLVIAMVLAPLCSFVFSLTNTYKDKTLILFVYLNNRRIMPFLMTNKGIYCLPSPFFSFSLFIDIVRNPPAELLGTVLRLSAG
jgi:hypothetical protein